MLLVFEFTPLQNRFYVFFAEPVCTVPWFTFYFALNFQYSAIIFPLFLCFVLFWIWKVDISSSYWLPIGDLSSLIRNMFEYFDCTIGIMGFPIIIHMWLFILYRRVFSFLIFFGTRLYFYRTKLNIVHLHCICIATYLCGCGVIIILQNLKKSIPNNQAGGSINTIFFLHPGVT